MILGTVVDIQTGEVTAVIATPEQESEWVANKAARDAAVFAGYKAALPKQIDADVDAIYAATIGARQSEYELAEAHATVYRDAGYAGTVPSSVQAWATVKGQTATWAADDILAAATGWRTAQVALRAARLQHKEDARNAADQASLDTVKAQWAGFVAAIRGQLGL